MGLTDSEYNPQPAADGDKKAPPEIIDVGNPATWKRISTPCKVGLHHLVEDSTELGVDAVRCTRCKIGWRFITDGKTVVDNK